MRKSLLHLAKTFLVICSFSTLTLAQDIWTPSEITGFGNIENYRTKCMQVFKGNLYAGAGDNKGVLYSSSTGNFGSWTPVFTDSTFIAIDDITSTNDGGGYMYITTYDGNQNPRVYRSNDGINWTFYYKGLGRVNDVISFKGQGTVDSIYVFEETPFEQSYIRRSSYDSNDPSDTTGAWETVFQVPNSARVTSKYVMNGRLYVGTSDGTLWSTSNGTTFTQNTYVGNGFGDGNNYEITALGSFGGYLYASTYNYLGSQLWRSNDDTVWSQVTQFPGYSKITSFEVASGQLWASMATATSGPGQIVKSSDGLTFTVSNNNGFGYGYNQGQYGNMTVFGNNLYYASENYGYPAIAPNGGQANHTQGFGFSTGGQIWRMCLGISPSISAGADQVKCQGDIASFTADAGFVDYFWDDGSTSQILMTSNPGEHYVIATDANGCSALDTVMLSTITSPSISVNSPEVTPAIICKGDSINLMNFATSNLRVDLNPVNSIRNDQFYDYTTIFDTINISGVNDFASTSLLSVTLDSLYHTNDGDLTIRLYAPDGSSAYLAQYVGYASQNFIGTVFSPLAVNYTYNDYGPFTGTYQPYEPFSYFTGNANGKWVLEISDVSVGSDLGTLKGWSLKFSAPDTVMNYSWSPAIGLTSSNTLNTIAYPSVNTNYTLTVTNSIGCSAKITDSIKVPSVHIVATRDSVCAGSNSILYASGATNPVWSPAATLSGSTGMNVIATPTANTTYFVNDTLFGCAVTDSIMIFANPDLIVSAGAAQSICFSDSTTINGTVTGGTLPYSIVWTEGANSYSNLTEIIHPASSTTYNLIVTDAFGCTQFSATDVTVIQPVNIYGHAGSTLGDVKLASVVLFNYEPTLTHFDTLQTTTTDLSGNFSFNSVIHGDYAIKVFPNTTDSTLMPTYYGNSFLWADSLKLTHDCETPDSINITMVEEIPGASGPGYLHGVIREGEGFRRAPGGPVPGIDVKLGRNPRGAGMVASTTTDANGEYSFSGVAYGGYIVYADIPGLGRDSSYTFTVDSITSVYNDLNYLVDSTTIRIDSTTFVGIAESSSVKENNFIVYPNPSKGIATIEYTVNNDSHVSIAVYNILGVKIIGLIDEKQMAGKYKISMNENKNLSSGVYFIALISDGKTSIHKIIITQ